MTHLQTGKHISSFTRITNALIKLNENYSDKNVLLVTHSFVARVINWYYNNLSFDEILNYSLGNCEIAKYTV